MLDSGSLCIEGVMPGGAKNAYTLPLDVYCFGHSEAVRPLLQQRLGYAGGSINTSQAFTLARLYMHATQFLAGAGLCACVVLACGPVVEMCA